MSTLIDPQFAPFAEASMLACFGASWPFSIIRAFRLKRVIGKSPIFLWLVMLGYVSGIVFKLARGADYVLAFYIFNLAVVAIDTMLYYRYRGNG